MAGNRPPDDLHERLFSRSFGGACPSAAILPEIESYPSGSHDAIRENVLELNNCRTPSDVRSHLLAVARFSFGDTQQPEARATSPSAGCLHRPDAGISTTIGLDLGDRWSRYCVVDGSGAVIEEDRVRTSTAGLEHRFRQIPAVRIVLEAGTHSPWVSRLLDS